MTFHQLVAEWINNLNLIWYSLNCFGNDVIQLFNSEYFIFIQNPRNEATYANDIVISRFVPKINFYRNLIPGIYLWMRIRGCQFL